MKDGTKGGRFLIVTGGDGYSTKIVDEENLDDAYLAAIYGDAKDVPAHQRDLLLEHLHDHENHWLHSNGYGHVRYRDDGCDGYIEIIRLTGGAETDVDADALGVLQKHAGLKPRRDER